MPWAFNEDPASDELQDDEEITHYGWAGSNYTFHPEPRMGIEVALSMTRGRRTLAEAAKIVRKRDYVKGHDRVRYTTVGCLRESGFEVLHAPSNENPDHVLVQVPGALVPWNDEQRDALVKAFDS